MSWDTWGQQIASSGRRGRFINTIFRWGLATADGMSDVSDAASLNRSTPCCKPLLQAAVASRCCKPLLQAAAASRCCKPLLQAAVANRYCKPPLQAAVASIFTRCNQHKIRSDGTSIGNMKHASYAIKPNIGLIPYG